MKRHQINHRAISIELVEAAPRLLPKLPKDASRAITKKLRSIGVKLYLGQSVQSENADSLVVNGKSIKSHTVIWTAGVTNHPFFKDNSFKLTQSGKVVVDEYLRAENDIFVLGDNASTPYSGMAQTALYDAVFVAKYLQRGSKSKPYKPKKPITIIPVGSKWAAVCAGQLRIYGWLGWMLREMADLVAFHDLEPWWRAGEQFMNEFVTEESCPVCATASQK
jgi:NADH dehydrogenase